MIPEDINEFNFPISIKNYNILPEGSPLSDKETEDLENEFSEEKKCFENKKDLDKHLGTIGRAIEDKGYYENVEISLSYKNPVKIDYTKGPEIATCADVKVKAPNKVYGSVGTSVNSSGSVQTGISVHFANYFDTLEKISCQLEKSFSDKSVFSCTAQKNFKLKSFPQKTFQGQITIDQKDSDMSNSLPIRQKNTGITLSVGDIKGKNKLSLNCAKRENFPTFGTESLSMDLLPHLILPSYKTSIILNNRYHFSLKRKNFSCLNKLKSQTELAGFGSETMFFKMLASYKIKTSQKIHVGLNNNMGFLLSAGSSMVSPVRKESLINDRFFMGGIKSFPGYKQNSMGPRTTDTGESIGGDAMFSSKLYLNIPLIRTESMDKPSNCKLFVSAGNVFNPFGVLNAQCIRNSIAEGVKTAKFSIGAVLDIPLKQINGGLKICATKILNSCRDEKTSALQFGFYFSA